MPISRQVRITRRAISPRLAINIFLNKIVYLKLKNQNQKIKSAYMLPFEPACRQTGFEFLFKKDLPKTMAGRTQRGWHLLPKP